MRQQRGSKEFIAGNMNSLYTFLLLILLSLEICSFSNAKDNITSDQILRDPETLVSSNSFYALGFFTPQNSTKRYLGIWYNQVSVRNYVWVANREKPINDSSGWLIISKDGNLQVLDGRNQTFWTSGVNKSTTPSMAKILDSGDFVLSGLNSSNAIWQSSQHTTDTLLQNLNFTIRPDSLRVVKAWKSRSDPSIGRYSGGTDGFILPQVVIWDGDRRRWRSGPWNGNNFIGIQNNFVQFINAALVVLTDQKEQEIITAEYAYPDNTYPSNCKLNYEGTIVQPYWNPSNKTWLNSWQAPSSVCDIYATCGAFGSCNSLKSPICRCLRGFEPKNKGEWGSGNWTGGCVRRKHLQCEGDGFLKLSAMKVPDYAELVVGLIEDGCRRQCLNNCSCLAYAYDSGIGCMVWNQSLIDVQEFSTSGTDLYIRLEHSELGSKTRKKTIIAVSVAVSAVIVLIIAAIGWRWMVRRKGKYPPSEAEDTKKDLPNKTSRNTNINVENLPLFEYKDLAIATNNFEESNKLGQGGFGSVYKGNLVNGQEIAVKRLSEASGQGAEEFMNEVTVISKLQHRNLVRLLGCSVEGEDKMLIYEYMSNRSLDAFIFDPDKRQALSWKGMFKIIEGICRGLIYLHRDSRLRIIHRDLKASNVLLDGDLNPKISDFGMARILWGNQDQDNTRRIVGTYGYMSPEYAMEGRISEKSDVYSFGVLLFEIITGIRNSSFWHSDEALSLMGYAWNLWNEGNIVSLIDETISDPTVQPEIVRCLHVGLLCVQEFAEDRPALPIVMAMLSGEITNLPKPKQPGFMLRHISSDTTSHHPGSVNNVSFTAVSGR